MDGEAAGGCPGRSLVPATLDLAERAALGVNALVGSLDPEVDYDPYFLTYFAANPPYMLHWSGTTAGCLPKYVEALPLLRLASGSSQGTDVEAGMVEAIAKNTSHDGLLYEEDTPKRPWSCGIGYGVKSWREDYASLACSGRLIVGFCYYYALTGDAVWLERARRTAGRVMDLVIQTGDYAYIPNVGLGGDFNYPKRSGWVHTTEPGHGREGCEGSTTFYLSQPIRGLLRWYRLTGDERALDVSRRLQRFTLHPRFWGGYNDLDPATGAARGHFWGHPHGNTATLRALLEYAVAVNDWRTKQFVRDGYEYVRHNALPELGLFPSVYDQSDTEGCTIADMVALAIQLTDAGLGDYWDDADSYVRNGLVEAQVTDGSELERLASVSVDRPQDSRWGAAYDTRFEVGIQRESLPGQECTERVIERSIGAISCINGVHYQLPLAMACCTPNGNQAIYYAWEAILRQGNDGVQVNLLLNRRSPWLDVESSLPYCGRVVLRNKAATRISVRVPGWVDRQRLRCVLDGVAVEPGWVGNYVVLDGARPGQVIELAFPVATEKRTLVFCGLNGRPARGAKLLACQFRGSTLVRIEGPGEDPGGRDRPFVRIFRRSHYESDTVPLKEAGQYVAPRAIRW